MSVQSGLLALLTMGPAYGSQLQAEFLARAANRRQLNAGQVYATLERLAARQLIESAGVTDDGLPLYALTRTGRVEAHAWLSSASVRLPVDWDDMQDQVLIAASLEGARPLDVIGDFARSLRAAGVVEAGAESVAVGAVEAGAGSVGAVDERAEPTSASPASRSAARADALNTGAALAWLDEVTALLEADAAHFVLDRNPDRPKRGRRPNA